MATYNGTENGDTYSGGSDADTINGNGGNDKLAGGGGGDTIDGGEGNDSIYAFTISPYWQSPFYGNNLDFVSPVLDTGSEIDTLNGGAGLDTIYSGYGDIVNGGLDLADLLISLRGATSGQTVDFRTLDNGGTLTIGGGLISNIRSVLWIEGSDFDDTIIGSDQGSNSSDYAPIFGRGGNDHLIAGHDTGNIYGGTGNDTIDAGNGGWFYGEDGDDILNVTGVQSHSFGGDGNDTLNVAGFAYGGAGNDTINMMDDSSYYTVTYGNSGDDTINGSENSNTILGGTGADLIYGNDGEDQLFSGGPDDYFYSGSYGSLTEADSGIEHDQLFGGAGDDRLSIGYGDDADGGTGTNTLALSLIGGSAGVTVDIADLITGGPYVIGGGTITNFQSLAFLWGTNFADTITMTAQSIGMHVYGMDGADTINGTDDADNIHGGMGADTVHAGGGNDFLWIDAAGEVAAGEVLDGGTGFDTIIAPNPGAFVTFDISAATLNGIESLDARGSARIGLTGAQLAGVTTLAGSFYFTAGGNVSLNGISAAYSITFNLATAGNMFDMTGFTGGAFVIVAGDIGDDTVIGSAGGEYVYANGGNDTLYGNGGSDVLNGGDGNDRLDGGVLADQMTGGAGDDVFVVDNVGDRVFELADEGTDTVESSLSFSFFSGANASEFLENITLTGSAAIIAVGNTAANVLIGNSGNNTLNGMANADRMEGRQGNDRYIIDNVGDTVFEAVGEGTDTVLSSVSWALAAGQEIEILSTNLASGTTAIDLTGNEFVNTITGNEGANRLVGGGGNDTIFGGGGADRIDGGTGADAMTGGTGDDSYVVDDAGDTVFEAGGEGTDRVATTVSWAMAAGQEIEQLTVANMASTNAVNLTGNEFANKLAGNDGANTLNGGGGNDKLAGAGGNDILDGGTGADQMQGGTGSDSYFVDDAADTVFEANTGGVDYDTVVATVSWVLGAGQEVERLRAGPGTDPINLTGNEFGQKIQGNEGANILLGDGGNDVIIAGGGDDTLKGGTGLDKLTGGLGADTFVFEHGGQMDQIVDFAVGTDKVDLTAFGLTWQDVQAAMTESNGNTILTLGGGDSVIFAGVSEASLSASDFLLGGNILSNTLQSDMWDGGRDDMLHAHIQTSHAMFEWHML